ncbi:FMN-binding protein [Paractinoplanes rishiriensis]|uniref:FMN-binding domain-containing protein n=1 Tax=Paractinoplanes rishiriensis TaxID=1050105 RepID=A0A919JYK1_9ACTN|nr:FMN-binding protein [Actinoplanes rishiriensis]GIE93326.1 hypothetical protein Ari01nite_07910 [Actinoplanes rishiriensis]
MRRSTAAAVGTLTGAALIVGVRLSVQPPEGPAAAPPAVDLAGNEPTTKPSGTKKPAPPKEDAAQEAPRSGLKDGTFKGKGATNPYGTIQVSIKVEDGKITAADATYPTTNDSATINPPAIKALREATLEEQSAEVAAVSGATYTTKSYQESLQAALDAAKA